jgi:ligand-binding sensor domain-containing protein
MSSKAFLPKISIITEPLISKVDVPKVLDNVSSGMLAMAGLESSMVFSAFIDRSGMKWFGTDHGLIKIDGQKIETYATLRRVSGITQDKAGRIWIATFNDGIIVLDIESGLQLNYVFNENVTDILCDDSNHIWIAKANVNGDGSLHRIGSDFGTIVQIVLPEKLDGKSISLEEDFDHNLWIGQHHSISMIDASRTKLKTFGLSEGLEIDGAINLFVDRRGDVWCGSFNKNVYNLSAKNKTLKSLSFEKKINVEFQEDEEGRLWIMGGAGVIHVLNKDKTHIMTVKSDIQMYSQTLSGSSIDELGNLWIASKNHGILMIDTNSVLNDSRI